MDVLSLSRVDRATDSAPDAKRAGAAAKRNEAALAAAAAAEHCLAKGKTDLLLRFFDSEFFDEWIAVSYLWRTKAEVCGRFALGNAPCARRFCLCAVRRCSHAVLTRAPGAQGVRDYLCNRMYTLDEDRVENYLSQIVSLAILRPSPALDRLVVDLCSRSVRLACKARPPASPSLRSPRCACA
jgi:hypothetical protein